MFREMRRKDRKVSDADAEALLGRGEYGILSTVCSSGYAYGVPLSYVYKDGSIYFHCAQEGLKVENIEANNKVSFCVVGNTEVLADKFSTRYESVIVFGTAEQISGVEKEAAMEALIEKYSRDYMEQGLEYIKKAFDITRLYRISMEHISAKARR
ncbi:MAG: pyridoxamine 5'-phosphate oxidase family protein [Bacillota bacterium]|nr:pyridoxamine 5'-phosphate oxidase family protein [Bacillota bacterium]